MEVRPYIYILLDARVKISYNTLGKNDYDKESNFMRVMGTQAHGIRLPIISKGDRLESIAAIYLKEAIAKEGITLCENDVVGITEAVVAKAQGNYAGITDVAQDIRDKFGDEEVGLIFPMMSRNRFLNILKGISLGAKKVYVLLRYPSDDVGNPLIDPKMLGAMEDSFGFPISANEFMKKTGGFLHPFTNINYPSLYQSAGGNIDVYISNDARDILKFTKNVLVSEVHARELTKDIVKKAGAEKIFTLCDVLSSPVHHSGIIKDSGYNEAYGVLGSNMLTDDTLKLFPRDCKGFVKRFRDEIARQTGVSPEVLVYADGAFKDPAYGIWELADPVVSPAYTDRLGGTPNELKLKFIADSKFGHLTGEEKHKAVIQMMKEKNLHPDQHFSEGTTPRKYADLLGSLCDLMSGSGDKGTPMVLIRGYFDDFATE